MEVCIAQYSECKYIIFYIENNILILQHNTKTKVPNENYGSETQINHYTIIKNEIFLNYLNFLLHIRHNLYNHIEQMITKSKKNVLISTSTDELVNLAKNLNPIFKKLKKKNVNIKILTQTNKEIKKHIDETQKFAEVIHTDNKARFCIVDGKEIIFMVLDDNEVHPAYDVGVWANTPLAKDLFEKF